MNQESILMEKGNTQVGVNQTVFRLLSQEFNTQDEVRLLDVPCGAGEFLRSISRVRPTWKVKGVELFAEPLEEIKQLILRGDARKFNQLFETQSIDVVTSISGVMVFDNVTGHLNEIWKVLKPQGLLILTNDNVLTIRDRFSFLFFGRLKRFKLNYSSNEGNWNLLFPQALWKLIGENGFEFLDCQYTSLRFEDYLFLPLALLIYPIWCLEIFTGKGGMPKSVRKKLFPFRSLLCRHYILSARKVI